MHCVCDVVYDSDYCLRLTFEDGSIRLVDLKDHLAGEVFEPLKDLRLFRTARLNSDLDTVVWENGSDMSPDFLYEISAPLSKEDQPAVRRVAETQPIDDDGKGQVDGGRSPDCGSGRRKA